MLNKELSAKDYKETMQNVWKIVRGYCQDDEEAACCITGAIENYFYDVENGASEYRALHSVCEELYIECDYLEEIFNGIMTLGIDVEHDDEDEELEDGVDLSDFISFAEKI